MGNREQQLRDRAYRLWQEEGEPHGRDKDHWDQAERELTADSGAESNVDDAAEASGSGTAADIAGDDDQRSGDQPSLAAGEAPAAAVQTAPTASARKPTKARVPRKKPATPA